MPENKTTAKERRQYRIDHGLCPECGKEAAPYYLCSEHRELGALTRMLNKMADRGMIKKEKEKGLNYYSKPHGFNGPAYDEFRWGTSLWDMEPNDKRLRPRLGKRPVDLDETLIQIFEEAGHRLQIEEVIAAWGKLRSKRKTGSLTGDMKAIIEAQQRREARNAKRAAVASRSFENHV